jgi:lipopolysaccharide biosynthesis protein
MKRLALFAHYDQDNLIDDYVVFYLQSLIELCDQIIFVSDGDLSREQLQKLEGFAVCAGAEQHNSYDFGSWKRALASVETELGEYDELLLLNDSCYAPLFPFADMFAAMSEIDCDFWGQTACREGRYEYSDQYTHLDSYFMVVRRPVIESGLLGQFFGNVEPLALKQDVIDTYELGFSRMLLDSGFRLGSYAGLEGAYSAETPAFITNDQFAKRCPCAKIRPYRSNPHYIKNVAASVMRISETYPAEMIVNHCRRVSPHQTFRYWFLPVAGSRIRVFSKGFLEIRVKYKYDCRLLLLTVRLFRVPLLILCWPVNLRDPAAKVNSMEVEAGL